MYLETCKYVYQTGYHNTGPAQFKIRHVMWKDI